MWQRIHSSALIEDLVVYSSCGDNIRLKFKKHDNDGDPLFFPLDPHPYMAYDTGLIGFRKGDFYIHN